MSAFLGPIHHWLFNKIQVVESRAFALAGALDESGKGSLNGALEEYGDKLEGADVAEILGDNSIHQFLSGLIARVEVLEAKIMDAANGNHELLLSAAEKHGRETAQKAISARGSKPESLDEIGQCLNDFCLEGMPCDPGATFESAGDKLMYGHTACNHLENWGYTSADPKKMCMLTCAWTKGLVSGLSENANFEVKNTIANGSDSCLAEIKLC